MQQYLIACKKGVYLLVCIQHSKHKRNNVIYFSQKPALKFKGDKNEGQRKPPGGSIVTSQVHHQRLSCCRGASTLTLGSTAKGPWMQVNFQSRTSKYRKYGTDRYLEVHALVPILNSIESIRNKSDCASFAR